MNKMTKNPLMIRTEFGEKLSLQLIRYQLKLGPGPHSRFLSVSIINEDTLETKAFTRLDEDRFIDLLGHLFNEGELAEAHLEKPRPARKPVLHAPG